MSFKNKKMFFYLSFLPLVLWGGFIFYLSSIPGSDIPSSSPVIPYLVHFFLFSVLTVFYFLPFVLFQDYRDMEKIRRNMVILFVFAFTDELHQLWVEGREFSMWDFLTDSLGIVFVWYFFKNMLKYKKLNKRL